MHIIIDGYNLIRRSDRLRRLERAGLEAGRNALINRLIQFRRIRHHRITVVFDGQEGLSLYESPINEGGIRVIFSSAREKADDVIKRITAKGNEDFLVVTSDRDIVHHVNRRGGGTISSAEFEEQMLKIIEQGISFPEKEKDNDDLIESPGIKKKGPARRVSRKDKQNLTRIRKL